MAHKFVRNPNFPLSKSRFDANGMYWKMEVRQWAFATFDVVDLAAASNVNASSSPFLVVPDAGHPVAEARPSVSQGYTGQGKKTVKFYAKLPGFTEVYLYDQIPSIPLDGVKIQVEVTRREAQSAAGGSSTQLTRGKTYSIQAPDAVTYDMDVNTIFRRDDLKTLFDDVPAGTEHVVMSAHGVRTKAERVTQERSNSFDPSTITMWMKGEYVDAGRLTVGNCEAIFQKLKSKVAANCVIWFGGCSMAFNRDFCFKAAKASGCNVVTVGNYLPFRKFPKYMVDLLDSKFNPFIFAPSATNTQSPADFCERQGTFKFTVPV